MAMASKAVIKPIATNKKRSFSLSESDARHHDTQRHGQSAFQHGSGAPHFDISIHFDGGSRGNPGLAGSGSVLSIRQSFTAIPATPNNQSELTVKRAKVDHGEQKTIHLCRFVGMKHTNNQAEYQGVIDALSVCKDEIRKVMASWNSLEPCTIDLTVHGDSDLVIQQLSGSWQCRNERLVPLWTQATRLLQDIQSLGRCHLTLTHVHRHLNQDADCKYLLSHVAGCGLCMMCSDLHGSTLIGLANLAMDSRETFMTTSDDEHTARLPLH